VNPFEGTLAAMNPTPSHDLHPPAREATADSPVPSSAASPDAGLAATFVGGGNMASAMLGALVDAGADAGAFHVVEPYAAQRERLAARFPGVRLHDAVSPQSLAQSALVVLAVKPQQMRAAAEALAPFVATVPAVLTIAAGIRTGDLSRWLGGYRAIVRAMPNTPAQVGAGISGVYADPSVDPGARAVATRVLEAAGEVVWLDDEAALDAVTGLSGSGPGYVFYLLEAFEQAGVDQGLDRMLARRLAYATFSGSLALATASTDQPATLRANVTSKHGTTERALGVLDARRVAQGLRDAIAAATARARELGDEYGAQ
jgi:pyrroline-5-carboxylate reductase